MNEKRDKKFFVAGLIMMAFSSIISVYAASYLFESEQVSYDNTSSGLTSTNVQDSLDELYNHATDYTSMDTRVTALEGYFQNSPNGYFDGNWVRVKPSTEGGFEIKSSSNTNATQLYRGSNGRTYLLSYDSTGTWGNWGPLDIRGNPILINGTDITNIDRRVSTLESSSYTIVSVQSANDTINAGAHKDISISIPSGKIPSGKSISAAFVMTTPNSAWVFAQITSYDSSAVRIGSYNSYTGALTGKYIIILLCH